jgi:hypothetical protein
MSAVKSFNTVIKVWEAWRREGGRTGHWGPLAALGARIRAWPANDLDTFEPYREPMPFVRKQFPLSGPDSRGLYSVEVHDPEDDELAQELERAEQQQELEQLRAEQPAEPEPAESVTRGRRGRVLAP